MPDWPHAPLHCLSGAGAFIVTAGTYQKDHLFNTPEKLSYLQSQLFALASEYGWDLQSWAVFSNHYHFIAQNDGGASTLRDLLRHLHSVTARYVNEKDGDSGRKVWFQYWDTHLTYDKSYFARLKYVHLNPVKYGLVQTAVDYPWCSARWFESNSSPAFYKSVLSFKIDRIGVPDEFEASPVDDSDSVG